jgi:very-short-patch-repair endonuclease
MMWFVVSKPVTSFTGSIGAALRYYQNALRDADAVLPEDTDMRSGMEPEVLEWIKKTPFFQMNTDSITLKANFPIGRYLRQLDPHYQHPKWIVDFLLRYEAPQGPINIVIEYDGFDAHFKGHDPRDVTAWNFESYMTEADIERQLTLQQYGYRFIRLNRFNIGKDPVATLSGMLERLVRNAHIQDPESVSRSRADAVGLGDGSRKRCTRCGEIKAAQEFFDHALRNGAGGYGRICVTCKAAFAPKPKGPRYSASWRSSGRWRRR